MAECLTWNVSRAFSIISLCSWICAQLPQIYTNYVTKSAEGISPAFLLLWLSGDLLSFLSCTLSDSTLAFQLYLSVFFLCNDVALCYQYYYYISVYPGKVLKKSMEVFESDGPETFDDGDLEVSVSAKKPAASLHLASGRIHPRAHPNDEGILQDAVGSNSSPLAGASPFKIGDSTVNLISGVIVNSAIAHASSTTFTATSEAVSPQQDLATFLAWCCTFVYVGSRIPQLVKNYKRQSVEGMSPLLFSSALSGNLFYTLSILSSCELLQSSNKEAYFLRQLPYILGSSGTIIFDMIYFYQRRIYRFKSMLHIDLRIENWED